MSIISAGNTTTTALTQTADTSGNLVFTTGGANTVALTLSNTQAATFAGAITSTSLVPSGSTVPTNGIYLPSSNTLGIATNSTQAININSNGVMTLQKQPRFSANLSGGGNQTCASGATVNPTFGSVNFDTTSSYNASTYTFTAPVTGYYQFNVRLRIDGITSSGYANMYLNTPAKNYNTIASVTANYTQFQLSVVGYMAANDTAYVSVASSGQTITLVNTQPQYSDFSGYLVG